MKKIRSISCVKKIRSDPNNRVQSEIGDLGHWKIRPAPFRREGDQIDFTREPENTENQKHRGNQTNKKQKENKQHKGKPQKPKFGGPGLPGSWNLWFSWFSPKRKVGDPYVSPKRKGVDPYVLMKRQETQRFQHPGGSGPPQTLAFLVFLVFLCAFGFLLFVVFPCVCLFFFVFWFTHEMDLIFFTHEWNGSNFLYGPGLPSQIGPYYWDRIWFSSHMKWSWSSSCVKWIWSSSHMSGPGLIFLMAQVSNLRLDPTIGIVSDSLNTWNGSDLLRTWNGSDLLHTRMERVYFF